MKIICWILGLLIIILLANFILQRIYSTNNQIKYGVSFSPNYAKYLGLDYQKIYIQILDDLKVRNLRLPTFWDTIQKDPQKEDFSELDFMLSEAGKREVKVISVLGIRQPRWPECHVPSWAKDLSLEQRQQKALEFIGKVVERYIDNSSIVAWQVENEPFISWFGENCDPLDKNFLQKEVELVRKLDNSRPVVITDSGEWSLWREAMKSSDILGISLYRKAHNPYFGYMTYPIPAFFYPLKSGNKKTIIAELQAEPWTQKAIPDTPLEQQIKLFTLQDLQDTIKYAQKTGFDEAYLWGVEWWFWMAQKGYPQYLDFAKTLF